MSNTTKEAQGERLKRARELKYEHAVDAAEALGLPVQTYLPYESGRTGFSRRAPRFADFFGVNLLWLLTGDGPMRPSDPHPVVKIFERIPAEKQPDALEMLEFYASRKGRG